MRSFAFHSRVERLCNALHKPSLFHLFQCLFQDIALAEHAEPLILLRKVESCSSVPVFLSKGGKALQNFVRKSLQRDVFKKFFSTLPDVYLFKTRNTGTKGYFLVKFLSI